MSDDIIDTIAEKVARATWGEGSGTAWDSLPRVARTGILAAAAAQVEVTLTALRSAGYEVVARPESLPLAALHEAMVAYDAYPSENAEDDYNPCMRVLDAARDLLDAEKAEEK